MHIFFHGGGYRSQDKYNFSFVAGPLVERGAVVVIPNYGLCPAVGLDDIVAQTRRSIAWVYRHARIMGGDPNAITISGHSAGAHIVARALEACWDDHGAPDDVIKAAISLSGIYDQEARRLSFLNQYLRLDQAQSLRNSSMFRTPRRRVPYVIAVAEHETGEYIRQSRDYAQALQGKSYDVSYLQVQGKNHYNILDAFLDFSHPWVMRSMNRCSAVAPERRWRAGEMLGVAPTGGFGRTDVGRRHAESFPEGVIEVGYVIEATCVGDAGYPVVAGEKLCPSQFQPFLQQHVRETGALLMQHLLDQAAGHLQVSGGVVQ